MTTELLSVKAAAARLGIGKDLLYRLCDMEEFPHYKIGSRIRIRDTDIDRWLATKKRGPACFRDLDLMASPRDGFSSTKTH